MNLTEICIRRPVLAWMLMASLIVFGLIAGSRIGVSQFPDVDFPSISVNVNWQGAAPGVVENDIVDVIEEALMQVEGVRMIESKARQGSASISVELDIKRNVDLALQDVQTKIAQVQRRLPLDIEPPTVSKSNPEDQPIMWLSLTGPFPRRVLGDYARFRVQDRLQLVPGVGEVILGGSIERNVRVWVDAAKLDARNLTVSDVADALRLQHVELPAGRIETQQQELNVRVLGEALNLDELRRLVVARRGGAPIYLEDVALVEDGMEDVRRLSRVKGVPAQGIGIKKQRGSNAVAVGQEVKKAMEEIRQTLPEGMEIGVNFDSTVFVEESVSEIEFELVLSVLLTALVCWLFLGSLANTLNIVLAIPMSLLGTVAVIYFLGYTLNTFTLLGLALAVGLVVDDAIMVLENIYRHAEGGAPRAIAAQRGTDEIKFAAMSATLAVVAIFIPVVFMGGIAGKYFLQFGVTLSVAVMLSYLEAITLAPARSAQMLSVERTDRNRAGQWFDKAFDRLGQLYERVLRQALARPVPVLLGALAVFGLALWGFKNLPGEFVPSQDQSRLMVRLQTSVGTSLEETDEVFKRAETYVNAQPEISRAFVVIGGFGGAGVNSGVIFITLVPPNKRDMTQNEFAAKLRKELNGYPGVKAVVQDLSQQGFTAQRGFPVEFSVRGPDWNELVSQSQRMMEELEASGHVMDVDTDYQLGMPELRVVPDRARAADLGVAVEDVAETLSALIGGFRAGKFSMGGRRMDIRLRLLAAQRSTPEDIGRLRVRGRDGKLIPLSALVTYETVPALQAIIRKDRERAISITANIAPGHSQQEAVGKVNELAKSLPVGYRAVLGGSSSAYSESLGNLGFALIMGIVFSYMILGSQFNSFLHPVTVLTILPLSAIGAVIALFITGTTLNIFSMIGLLLLMGIVKKNSIILVDYAIQVRNAENLSASEAMIRAGPVRLRPILMTSVATLMAAIPPALSLGPGGEIRQPMAAAVIGGVIVSTVLSLVVVPCFYLVADRIKGKVMGSRT